MLKGLLIICAIGLTQLPLIISQTNYIVNNSTVGVCICVTIGSCSLAGGSSPGTGTPGSTDGSGNIDVRIVNVSVPMSKISFSDDVDDDIQKYRAK